MNNLPTVVRKTKKRVGRGVGSGKGFHTTGRGQKGQKARYKVGVLFEGVKTKKSLLHRLPMLPGKGKNKSRPKPLAVSITTISKLPAGEVSAATLFENGILTKKNALRNIKIVGKGEVTKKYDVKVSVSKSVADAITAAGGTIA